MTKRTVFVKIGIFACIILCAVLFGILLPNNTSAALAATREKVLAVRQESPLYYCGKDYLNTVNDTTVKEAFLQAFSATFDDEEFEIDLTNTEVTCAKSVRDPGTYLCTFVVNDGTKDYTANDVEVKIRKKDVVVTVYLNGSTDLTVMEGDTINISYDYDGAIEGDYHLENTKYGMVRVLNTSVCDSPAYVASLPDYVVQNYTVSAYNATSKYYSFSYQKSTLNIVDQTIPELTLVTNDEILVYLFGEFSSASKISFVNIGTSSSSPDYMAIKKQIDSQYDSTEIKDGYESVACYSLNVSVNETTAQNVSCNVFIAMDSSIMNRSSYKVIAFYNNGDSEVLNARTINNGTYLVFSAKDMGQFVVVSPVQGVKISTYIIVISIAVVFVLLVIFFVSLFRRKY